MAGLAWIKDVLEKWVAAGADPEQVPADLLKNDDEFAAILMDDCGRAFMVVAGRLLPYDAEYHAIGSGGMMAMGAMAHGASAIEAVRAACKHDKASGGDVNHVTAPYRILPMTPAPAAPFVVVPSDLDAAIRSGRASFSTLN